MVLNLKTHKKLKIIIHISHNCLNRKDIKYYEQIINIINRIIKTINFYKIITIFITEKLFIFMPHYLL